MEFLSEMQSRRDKEIVRVRKQDDILEGDTVLLNGFKVGFPDEGHITGGSRL